MTCHKPWWWHLDISEITWPRKFSYQVILKTQYNSKCIQTKHGKYNSHICNFSIVYVPSAAWIKWEVAQNGGPQRWTPRWISNKVERLVLIHNDTIDTLQNGTNSIWIKKGQEGWAMKEQMMLWRMRQGLGTPMWAINKALIQDLDHSWWGQGSKANDTNEFCEVRVWDLLT